MAMQIDKSIIMGELLSKAPGTADILQAEGMGCIFCPCAQVEALGEAAATHGVDASNITISTALVMQWMTGCCFRIFV